jgi:Na+-driven multidrug efflux pump
MLIHFYLQTDHSISAETMDLAKWLLAISALSLMIDSLRNITTGALRGLYDSRYPMYLSVILMWGIGLPVGLFLAFKAHWGVIGFASANGLAVLLCELFLWRRWNSKTSLLLNRAELSDLAASDTYPRTKI